MDIKAIINQGIRQGIRQYNNNDNYGYGADINTFISYDPDGQYEIILASVYNLSNYLHRFFKEIWIKDNREFFELSKKDLLEVNELLIVEFNNYIVELETDRY